MKPEHYDALLRQARDSPCGMRLAMQGWTPGVRVRRRLYSARDRARKRGDRSFDSLSVIFRGPVDGVFGPTEVWIVRRDRVAGRNEPEDDGLGVYPTLMDEYDLPSVIRARGPNRPRIPQDSLGPPFGCVGPVSCDIIKRFLMGEFDDVAERLAAADAADPDPDPRDAREMTLEEAGVVLERLAAARGRNGRSRR